MVGVPGKSKGCSTCRRRKKGCDQKRPSCGQCISAGYVCGGYQRDLIFIVHPATKHAEKSYYLQRRKSSTSPVSTPSLDRVAIDTQCKALFWDIFLPHGSAQAPAKMLQMCNQPPNWTAIIQELPLEDPALQRAFSALSISRVGRSNNDLRLVKESTRLYGRALHDLQRALSDEERSWSESVLAACSLLGLYEVFEGGWDMKRSVGWVSHAQGAARLIELRGPERHTSRHAYHLFAGARLPILFSAIVRRKRTFLEQEPWRTIPWEPKENMKTYFEVLIDHCTSLPGLLEDFDAARTQAAHPSTPVKLLEVLDRLQQLQKTLETWDSKKKPGSRPVTQPHEHVPGDDYPFDEELVWDNHLFLNASLICWSAQFMVATTCSQIMMLLASIGFSGVDTYRAATVNQQNSRDFAILIAKSIPYAFTPDMGALGVNIITFPICLAFKHFLEANDERVCSWMVKVNDEMRQQGVGIGSFGNSVAQRAARHKVRQRLAHSKHHVPSLVESPPHSVISQSDSSLDGSTSPTSTQSSRSSYDLSFVHENPAQYYLDLSEPVEPK